MHPRAAPPHRSAAAAAAVMAPGEKPLHLGQPRFWSASSPAEQPQEAGERADVPASEAPSKATAAVGGTVEDDGAASGQTGLNPKALDASRKAAGGVAGAEAPAQGKRKRAADGGRRPPAAADAPASAGGGAAARQEEGVAAEPSASGPAASLEAAGQSAPGKRQPGVGAPPAVESVTVAAAAASVPPAASVAAAQPLVPTLFGEEGDSSDSEGSLPEIDSGSDSDSE